MKVIGIIPARYDSSRLPGKPLADICGRPMIWWVYQQAKKVQRLEKIYVAADDDRVRDTCQAWDIPVIMTSKDNPTHLNRIYEVAQTVDADLYTVICGDEPLIKSEVIGAVIPDSMPDQKYIARALMREIKEPTEAIDPGNIKIAANDRGDCIYLSRSPIPFPYKTVLYKFWKIVGIECYNKAALDFFVHTPAGDLERIEDIAILRFMENKIGMHFRRVVSDALSVDTQRDLEKVRLLLKQRLETEGGIDKR